eukprot:COSAG01_NODE_1818_length_9161_cov_4.764316_11_plen_42_part_01
MRCIWVIELAAGGFGASDFWSEAKRGHGESSERGRLGAPAAA